MSGDGESCGCRCLAKKVEMVVHPRMDLGDGGVQCRELSQLQSKQELVPTGDASGQRCPQLLRQSLDAALHLGEQRVRAGLSVDRGLQDGTANDAHHLAQQRTKL